MASWGPLLEQMAEDSALAGGPTFRFPSGGRSDEDPEALPKLLGWGVFPQAQI